MGNRTYLMLGDCCQFEANNCVPVNWLALFDPEEFFIDEVVEEEEEESYTTAGYRTTASEAGQRVRSLIAKLKGSSPVWTYFKPLEILRDELDDCSDDDPIQMDLTQLYQMIEQSEQWTKTVVSKFQKVISQLQGKPTDEEILDNAINKTLNPIPYAASGPLKDLSSEDKMFTLLGMYDSEDLEKYSLEYFDDDYWAG